VNEQELEERRLTAGGPLDDLPPRPVVDRHPRDGTAGHTLPTPGSAAPVPGTAGRC